MIKNTIIDYTKYCDCWIFANTMLLLLNQVNFRRGDTFNFYSTKLLQNCGSFKPAVLRIFNETFARYLLRVVNILYLQFPSIREGKTILLLDTKPLYNWLPQGYCRVVVCSFQLQVHLYAHAIAPIAQFTINLENSPWSFSIESGISY